MRDAVKHTQVKPSPGGTPYANSRIRAARTRLLPASEIEAYLEEPTLGAFEKRLAESPYARTLEVANLSKSGIFALDRAIGDEFRTRYAWVYEMSEKKYRRLLAALAGKWDVADLKTIIRAKAAGEVIDPKNISFVGAGVTISQSDLQALAKQPTLEDLVNLALTWKLPYGKAFSEGLEAYDLDELIADFELKLDQAYVQWASKQFKGLGEGEKFARRTFGQEIDKLNIATLIRLVDTVEEVEEPLSYFLEGGLYLDKKKFESLIEAEDIYDLVEQLDIDEYRKALKEGYDRYQMTGHLSEIERALEVRLTKLTIKEGYRDILGFGIALSYLTACENEASNLTIIAHGVQRAVKPETIREELILV